MIVRGLLAGAVGTLLVAGAAFAQGTPTFTQPQLQFLDKDGDGAVSQQEYLNYLGNAFNYLDTDGNGSLSRAEAGGLLSDSQFSEMDTNRNGQISRQEFLAQGSKDFAGADKDKSGQLQ